MVTKGIIRLTDLFLLSYLVREVEIQWRMPGFEMLDNNSSQSFREQMPTHRTVDCYRI